MSNNNRKSKDKSKNNKNVCSCEPGCDCNCGYGWWGKKHWVIRLILWIAIISFVFAMGVAVGKFKAYFSNYRTFLRGGGSYSPMMLWDNDGNSYMMRRFQSPTTGWDALPPATDGVP